MKVNETSLVNGITLPIPFFFIILLKISVDEVLHCGTLSPFKINFKNGKCFFMPRLVCRDYGFDCKFLCEDSDVNNVISNFAKHMNDEHAIEYSKEALMQFILRQSG